MDYFSSEWSLVWVTIFLAVVTASLAVFTYKLWQATVKLGRDAVRGVEQQDTALKNVERAYLFIEVVLDGPLAHSPSGLPNSVRVKIWNHGKTPAEVLQIRFYVDIKPEVPNELLSFPGSDVTLPPGLGIAQNFSYDVTTSVNISDKDFGEIEHGYKTPYAVGLVRYKDIFGYEHRTGFCWFYSHHMIHGQFIIAPESALNERT